MATQTALATTDISAMIAAIQSDTGRSVEAIRSISLRISGINEVQSAIAAALEEQTATTADEGASLRTCPVGPTGSPAASPPPKPPEARPAGPATRSPQRRTWRTWPQTLRRLVAEFDGRTSGVSLR